MSRGANLHAAGMLIENALLATVQYEKELLIIDFLAPRYMCMVVILVSVQVAILLSFNGAGNWFEPATVLISCAGGK